MTKELGFTNSYLPQVYYRWKVVRTPTNSFETADNDEMYVPKEIIVRRLQEISAAMNKGRKSDHYFVVWEGYPRKKDYTWNLLRICMETRN